MNSLKLLTWVMLGATLLGTGAASGESKVVWQPGRIEDTLGFEGRADIQATITSPKELPNVKLSVVPSLQPYVSVTPDSFDRLAANTPYQVTVSLSVPHGTYPGVYEGTIHIVQGKATLPETLKVALTVFYEGVTIPPTTKVFSGTAADCIAGVSSDKSQVTLSCIPPQIRTVAVGDIIVLGVTPQTPMGLLRRVVSVYQTGGNTVLITSPASLEDAIESGSIDARVQLPSGGGSSDVVVSTNASATNVMQSQQSVPASSFINDYWTIDEVIYDHDGREETTGDQVRLVGGLGIESSFVFRLSIEDFRLRNLYFSNISSEILDLQLEAQFDRLFSIDEDVELFSRSFNPIVLWIGWVPIVITPELVVNAGVEGEASAYFKTGMTQTADLEAGLKYENGRVETIWEVSTAFNMTATEYDADMELKGYIEPRLNLFLYGLVGPYADAQGYLMFESGLQRQPRWCLYGGLEGTVGIDWEALSQLLDMEGPIDRPLLRREWIIAQAPMASGNISGTVKDAVTRNVLQDVLVQVFSGDLVIANARTNSSGNYTVVTPVGSDYKVKFTKEGYLDASVLDVSVQENTTNTLETVLYIDNAHSGPGDVGGYIYNALNGSGVNGLTIKLRNGINVRAGAVVSTTMTASGGSYVFSNVSAGNYTAEVGGTGYVTTYFTVISIGGMSTGNQNATITPVLPEGQTRIILTWGATPSDLDSHLTGPLPDGSRFHMYYPLKGSSSPWPEYVNLDLDDVTSYGPETTTIIQQIPGVYRFSVHDYTNRNSVSSTALSNSGAQVRVYRGSDIVASFPVPTGQGGTLWTVFELNGDTITPINALSYASSPSGIQSLQAENEYLFSDLPPKDEITQATEANAADFSPDQAEEALAFAIFEAGETINQLTPEDFNTEGSPIQLADNIASVSAMLDDGLYFEALAVLDNDILQRTDGCANTGEPDEDDWITSTEGQALLYPLVVETIELLESLI